MTSKIFGNHKTRAMMALAICLWPVTARAAAVIPEVRIIDFEREADAVSEARFEQAGFALETRRASGALQWFVLRNPPPGPLNLNGLNTVPYNGTRYLSPFTSSITHVWNLSGLPFSLQSIDVAEYSAVPDLVTQLRLTGTKTGGATVVATFNINRPVLGQMGDFVQLKFNEEWTSLEHLTIAASDSSFRFYNGFSLDNVALAVIPEPSPALLLAAGACLFAARHRRQ